MPMPVLIAPRAVSPTVAEARARWDDDRGDPAARLALVVACERAAEAVLRAEPGLGVDALVARLGGVPGLDAAHLDAVELRPGERLVVWCFGDGAMSPANACVAASVLRGSAGGWTAIGRSLHDAWGVAVHDVDPGPGIAYLVESYAGNGAPPAQGVAVAVVGDRVVTAATGLVADVALASGATPGLTIRRRLEPINPYPDPPITAAGWWVERAGDGLIVRERALTPWIAALAAACADGTGATPAVRAQLIGCHRVDRVWHRADGAVAVALLAELLTPDPRWPDEPGDAEAVDVVLELRGGGDHWLVTGLRRQ